MIRYKATRTKLTRLIKSCKDARKNWLKEAEKRTADFRTKGCYDEKSSIWGEVKPAYMKLQNNKCAYCERKLEGGPRGRIQHDLEHFRPKSNVRAWPTQKLKQRLQYDFDTGDEMSPGYFLLAYNLFNYCAACKTCNTPLKSDYFPIAAGRVNGKDEPEEYKDEQPDLIYPIGTVDSDPSSIITFEGVVAVPKFASGNRYRRARVTIDFFELNRRDDLRTERGFFLDQLARQLEIIDQIPSGTVLARARESYNLLLSDGAPHSSCLNAFDELWNSDRPRASKHAMECKDLAARYVGQ